MNWICLSEDRDNCWSCVTMVMLGSIKCREFLVNQENTPFQEVLLHGVCWLPS